ncbi:hypothetical protein J437_LFUL010554, partial [Ladona fulva]
MTCGHTLPTLYEYYSEGGIKSSLEAPESGFKLNGKDITIFSGAIHYFRLHPNYWRDRLRKLRAAGLNTVETNQTFNFEENDAGEHTLDLLVENCGRVNYGTPKDFEQKKGLWEGPVIIDKVEQSGWEITALQFKSEWVKRLDGWKTSTMIEAENGPILVRGTFEIEGEPADTWIDMSKWGKGIVIINGFNMGRYFYLGPTKTIFIPAPFLHSGLNEVMMFEYYAPAAEVKFTDVPILHPRDKEYLRFIKKTFEENGLEGLFTTCDTPGSVGDIGSLPDVLQTATFSKDPEFQLQALKKLQPNRALMVMEYWSGWYDHWLDENHQTGLSNAVFHSPSLIRCPGREVDFQFPRYIPWNLHEPRKGEFDFGNGESFLSKFLDVRRFIKTAQEEDLLVIIRPGPYICTEWEFGGLPSWLLRTPNVSVRTSDPYFTERVKIYFDNLLPQLVDLQFIKGGSIIIVQ